MTETVIRCSALSGYTDCPRRGAARLFWREIRDAGFELRQTGRTIGALIGSATHFAAEVMLKEKARSALPPLSVATDAAAESLTEQLAHGETLFDAASQNRDVAGKQAIRMARLYHHTIAPKIDAVVIEQRFEAEIEPGLVLSGQPDIVGFEPAGPRDLKTGLRLRPNWPQIGGYALLVRSNSLAAVRGAIDFLRRVNPAKPQPEPISQNIPLAQAELAASHIVGRMMQDLKSFQATSDPWSFAANPSSVLCSRKYCSAHSTPFCEEWRANE